LLVGPVSFVVLESERNTPPVSPCLLNPTPHTRAVFFVLISENRLQPGFLDRDYSPIEVSDRERQKNNRPNLFQQSGLSQVCESQAYIHRISSEAIRSPGHKLRRWPAGNRRRASLTEYPQPPTRNHRADRKQYSTTDRTHDGSVSRHGGRTDGFQGDANEICHNEHPWNRHVHEEPKGICDSHGDQLPEHSQSPRQSGEFPSPPSLGINQRTSCPGFERTLSSSHL
jgi:hypothetical protein